MRISANFSWDGDSLLYHLTLHFNYFYYMLNHSLRGRVGLLGQALYTIQSGPTGISLGLEQVHHSFTRCHEGTDTKTISLD